MPVHLSALGTTPLRLLVTLAVLGLFAAAALFASARFFTRPAHIVIGPAPPDLSAESVAIPSASGAILSGWFVAGRAGGGAVVLMHGLRESRLIMVARARRLREAGFSLLLFDFQAHGESGGERMSFGALEAHDARAAVAYLRTRLPSERIGAIGISLGGAASVLGPGPLPVDALVLESAYPDIHVAIENRLRNFIGPLARPLTLLYLQLLKPLIGVDPSTLRPIDRIGTVTAPLLIASGTQDERTTIAESRQLFERAPEPKQFWAVEGARHEDLEAFAPEEYWRRILPFLAERLRR